MPPRQNIRRRQALFRYSLMAAATLLSPASCQLMIRQPSAAARYAAAMLIIYADDADTAAPADITLDASAASQLRHEGCMIQRYYYADACTRAPPHYADAA